MNSVNAVVGCSLWMRKLRKNTRPSVTSISTIGVEAAEDHLAERRQAGDSAARVWIAAPPAA